MSRKQYRIAIAVVFVVIAAAGAMYEWIVPGLSSARTVPPKLEIAMATWLLHQSVPAAARSATNPLGLDAADIVAGRDLFRENCEVCHAYDGSGRTRIGSREYPHAPPLRVAARSMSDGEVFYHIRNGIRNTGMPAWDMPDRQIWQLVTYIRRLPRPARLAAAEPPESDREGPVPSATYVGSAACKSCHEEIYYRWSKTRMANVVRDPREHPRRHHPRLFQTRSARHLHQGRYRVRLRQPVEAALLQKGRRRLFPVTGAVGRHAQGLAAVFRRNGTDWWAPFYPPDNFKRPTGPLCDGCHSVSYDIATKTVTRVERRAARRATGRAARTPRSRRRATSSIPHASTTCMRTTPASSAIRRAGR